MTLSPEAGGPKRVTLAELTELVTRAKRDPTEKARLQENPEAVLDAMDRIASPGAVEFLRSLGDTPFDENADMPKPGSKGTSGGMAEI